MTIHDPVFPKYSPAIRFSRTEILIKKCGLIINMLQEKYRVLFYRCIPVPDGKEYTDQYFNNSSASYAARKADGMMLRNKKNLAKYIELLQDIDYQTIRGRQTKTAYIIGGKYNEQSM